VLTDGCRRYRARFALELRPGERVVGFGERFDLLDQRGRLVDTRVYDQYKSQRARSYLPVPFALVFGDECFGLHVATGRRCFFDVGASDPGRLVVETDLEPGGGDGERIAVEVFNGSPAEIVRAFSSRTCPQIDAPPEWIYRLWLSGNEWNSEARVRAEVAAAAAADIRVGALVIEAWSDEQTFVAFNGAEYEPHSDGSPHSLTDFVFPSGGPWPDPKRLVEDLHDADIRVLLWQIPLVQSEAGQAGLDRAVMVERGYCVRNDDGTPYRTPGGWFNGALMLDFTSDEASEWWLAKRRYLIDELGIDGFKTDGGEHAWASDLRYADGTRGGDSNNRYPVLYQSAYHRLMRRRGRSSVTFSRAGFTGSGATPCHWAGDQDSTWESFRAAITAGLTAAVSGVFYWGWDIAGFSGPLPTPELYLRATAMAALCPIMQIHSEFNYHRTPSRDRTPWNVAAESGDSHVVPLFRRFTDLRERLVPYLAQTGERAARDRVPMMRPLCLDFPHDDRAWEFPFQYMLGDALLVAPVCQPAVSEWPVYLPEGDWVALGSEPEETIAGGRALAQPAPLAKIPVFCKAARTSELAPLFAPLHSSELLEVS
jgi:alpha-glucosidase (family GH31 glycosyl hydrolase)